MSFFNMRPILLTLGAVVALVGLDSCQQEAQDPCVQETISDPNYFNTARTLGNNCVSGDGIDYYLTGNQTYSITADLVIEPGTKIVVGDSAALVVETSGSIYAIGRVDAPVEFTSANPTPGAWWGILVRSNQTRNELKHVNISYAGGEALTTGMPAAALALANGSSINLSYTQLLSNAGYGIALESNAATLNSIEYCTFGNNADGALKIPALQVHKIGTTNTYNASPNNHIDVRIGGTITDDVVWATQAVPYQLFPEDSTASRVQSISGNGRLTIAQANTLLFNDETGFQVTDNARFFASGTADNPILFTGVRKAAGVWQGIELRSTRGSKLEYTRIEHSGSSGASIYMWNDPTLELVNVDFTYSPACAIVDAPKSPNQRTNPNLTTINVTYVNVSAQYCKEP